MKREFLFIEQATQTRLSRWILSFSFLLFALYLLIPNTSDGEEPVAIPVGCFSCEEPLRPQAARRLPQGWQALTFKSIKKHTSYTLVQHNNTVAIRAEGTGSASGIYKSIDINLQTHPVLSWYWQVDRLLQGTNIKTKSGDDCPARILVSFGENSEAPDSVIAYIWGSEERKGEILPSPYSDGVRLFVLQGGRGNLGKWIKEERNIRQDYRQAFGKEASHVSSITIMTDSDNTNQAAVAYFGDITFFVLPKEHSPKSS